MITKQAESNVPTDYGIFKIIAFSEKSDDWMPQMALIAEGTDLSDRKSTRLNSSHW